MRLLDKCLQQVECYANALRFGFVFVRSRGFQIPRSIRVAGRSVPLHFPPDQGVCADFFTCVVRNEYGLGHGLSGVRTIVDIGANVGFFSMAARARYPEAIIHSYEPNPRVLPALKNNVADLRVQVFPEAVGGKSGLVSMIDSGDSNQARTSAGVGSIPMVSLATVLDRLGRPLDLLKLDCEGAEWEMFPLKECWQQ
jgi:FkbM family methyltransferase